MNINQSPNSCDSHIAWVDFLRILACFLVVLAHCCDPFVGSFDGSFNFKSAVFWGSLVRPCVPLFAMISGVLLFPVTLEMGVFTPDASKGYWFRSLSGHWRFPCSTSDTLPQAFKRPVPIS